MDIKLIALDLDGTLLNDAKQISERNIRALKRCIEKGIYIVPTTGRTVKGIPEAVLAISGISYAITVNGGKVEELTTHKVIHEELLSKETAIKVFEKVKDYPIMYDAYINGRGKAEERFLNHLDLYGIKPEIQELVRKTRDKIENIFEYVQNCPDQVEKVNLFFADMELREKVRKELASIPDIIITSSMGNNLEINAKQATKGNGIKKLAEYLGLSIEQTMAFGDGENDVSMIQEAHMGVAMGNAMEVVKKVANYVTLSNEEDGVAAAIEKFVLGE